ncbi:YoaK family protein [Flavobacterium sp.]|uniref:YoaK family protein n=1 Tax=Flavobacterium sp. TaxID=239 RepID=UPI002624F74A|nr:YoaK family protein [Flavobacterium sp.]
MFRHKGSKRTFLHNLRLASNLSFIAGIVNIAGVLSVATLTTNVTGHFAFFAEEISLKNYSKAITFLLFILSFLVGAFTCSTLIEITSLKKPRIAHAFPIIIEIIILVIIGLGFVKHQEYIAYLLLFSMGIQNALVTQISQSVVRTTHLTGLFTDLGIELSQLLFNRKPVEKSRLRRSIFLRLSIILCFFLGGVLGGVFYEKYKLKILLFAALSLIIALIFDNIVIYYHLTKRKIKSSFHDEEN